VTALSGHARMIRTRFDKSGAKAIIGHVLV
jgi:hypothetical protein